MDSVKRTLYRAIFITSAVFAGICLYMILSLADINKSILTPEFHKKLFEKNDIYYQVYNITRNSIAEFLENLKKNSPHDYEQNAGILNLLEKSITPGMVKENLDTLRDGIFKYFRGETDFLPDIFIDMRSMSGKDNTKATAGSSITSGMLHGIDRINLAAILLYINRNDITDWFMILKLFYYIINKLPGLILLLLFLFSMSGFAVCKKPADMLRWAGIACLAYGFTALASSLLVFAYTGLAMPSKISPVAMSLPLPVEVTVSYIRNCINRTVALPFITGIFFTAAAGIMLFHHSLFRHSLFPILTALSRKYCRDAGQKSGGFLKYTVYPVIFILIVATIGYKLHDFSTDFEKNNFFTAISKLKSNNTSTRVISARDETMYTLEVKLTDRKTGKPVSDAKININGKSGRQEKHFDEYAVTDSSGSIRLALDRGTFLLSFMSSSFPGKFVMPSPFFFDIKTAGTTIITVCLDTVQEVTGQNPGIAEIEVLDRDNKPVPDTMLRIQPAETAPHMYQAQPNSSNAKSYQDIVPPYPDSSSAHGNDVSSYRDNLFSYTNSEGIAVFKLLEGNYQVSFTGLNFDKQYRIPSPVDVVIKAGKTSRYTIRLAEKSG